MQSDFKSVLHWFQTVFACSDVPFFKHLKTKQDRTGLLEFIWRVPSIGGGPWQLSGTDWSIGGGSWQLSGTDWSFRWHDSCFPAVNKNKKKHVTNAYLKLNVYVCLQCGTHGKMHCFLLKIHSWKNIASEYFKTKSIRRINYMYNFNDIPWSEIQAGQSVLCFYQFNILLIALSLVS